MRTLAVLGSIPFLGVLAVAQTTHLVGPGGFATIADAIAAANNGDIVLVQPGAYWTFGLLKGLTIRAVTPGTVTVGGIPSMVVQPPPGQVAHFVGLNLPMVLVSGSRATFDRCMLRGSSRALSIGAAEVHLQDCAVLAPPQSWWGAQNVLAIDVQQGHLSATNCTIEGPSSIEGFQSGSAIRLTASTLRGSYLMIRSGSGQPGAPAIVADIASTYWLSDSTISCDLGECPITSKHGRVDRCTVTPDCGNVPTGFVLGARRLQPPQLGGTLAVEFRTLPNALVAVFASHAVGRFVVPGIEQPALLSLGAVWGAGLQVADSAGLALPTWAVPANPALLHQAIWVQGVSGMQGPLQASPVVGGILL